MGSPTGTTFTDTTVTNGTTYFYVVSSTNAVGESGNSAEASATPTAAQPASVTVSVPPTTAHDTLVVVATLFTGTTKSVGSISDSSGATWNTAEKVAAATSGSNGRIEVWWHANVPGGVTSLTLSQPAGQTAISKWAIKVLELNGVASATALDVSSTAANAATTTLETGVTGPVAAAGEFVLGAIATGGTTTAVTLDQTSSTPTTGWVALSDFGTGTTSTDVLGRAAVLGTTTAGAQYQVGWSTSAVRSGGGAIVVFRSGP